MSQHTGPSARSPGFPREGREAIQRPLLPSLHVSVRRARRALSVGEIPTRQHSLQPVAIGAVVEVTKRPKPLV